VRLRAGLAAGDPTGEVTAAWQGIKLLRAVYAPVGPPAARTAVNLLIKKAKRVGARLRQLRQLPAAATAPLRGGMANPPDREIARPLTTLGGVAPLW
jgi:hypothetical protein